MCYFGKFFVLLACALLLIAYYHVVRLPAGLIFFDFFLVPTTIRYLPARPPEGGFV